MTITRTDRRVVTFYSYKGGVGRSMALANVAFRLADFHALDVVVVDWDLEAPGLAQFFGIPAEKLAEARGVLDYLEAWREAAKRRDPSPPDVRSWLIRIDEPPRAPRHGSLSLLIAGRPDKTYDARLAALDWKDFYANSAGALAVETLRKQLVESADVVLIDSRTGLTDAGGICTIQLPDAVVLMTTPNRQSLEGTERIARAIANAEPRDRAGRARSMAWLAVCRLPSVEETILAEGWLERHKPEFDRLVENGVLDREQHPNGLASHTIPQRARWGFDEVLLTEHAGVGRGDVLLAAYEHLSVTILDWTLGEGSARDPFPHEREPSIEDLEKRAQDAEARRDSHGHVAALLLLGRGLRKVGRFDEAARALERAADIALGAELHKNRAEIKLQLAYVFDDQRRFDDAVAAAGAALEIAREQKIPSIEANALGTIAFIIHERDGTEAALPHFTTAIAAARASGQEDQAALLLHAMVASGKRIEAERALAKVMGDAASITRGLLAQLRKAKEPHAKIALIESLLEASDAGFEVPEVDALRAQLDVLRAGAPPSASPKKRPRRAPKPTR